MRSVQFIKTVPAHVQRSTYIARCNRCIAEEIWPIFELKIFFCMIFYFLWKSRNRLRSDYSGSTTPKRMQTTALGEGVLSASLSQSAGAVRHSRRGVSQLPHQVSQSNGGAQEWRQVLSQLWWNLCHQYSCNRSGQSSLLRKYTVHVLRYRVSFTKWMHLAGVK